MFPRLTGPSVYVLLKTADTWLRIWAAVPCLRVYVCVCVCQGEGYCVMSTLFSWVTSALELFAHRHVVCMIGHTLTKTCTHIHFSQACVKIPLAQIWLMTALNVPRRHIPRQFSAQTRRHSTSMTLSTCASQLCIVVILLPRL